MNAVDAAYRVLLEAGKPLHYTEITRQVIQSKLWLTSGKTPERTVNRQINQEIIQQGKLARFVHLAAGMFATVSQPATTDEGVKTLPPEVAFIADAWAHLTPAARQQVLHSIRSAITGQPHELDDPVIALALPNGPRAFPRDFVDGDIGPVRINLHVSSLCEVRLIPGAFNLLVAQLIRFVQTRLEFVLNRQRHFQCHGLNHTHEQFADGSIDLRSRDVLTDGQGLLDPVTLANIVNIQPPLAGVITDGHPLAANAAHHQALQQRRTFAGWALSTVKAQGQRA